MTLRSSVRFAILTLAASSLVACGGPEALDPAAQRSVEAAEVAAEEALARSEDLELRIAGLEDDLVGVRRDRRALARELSTRNGRLQESMAALRSSLKELRALSAGATDEAESAAATAAAVTRDLTVLTRRFDYHLRSRGER
ncbi:hypothetical protein BH24ACT26_BH24ACT26_04140 [soil metagenome]